MSNFHNVAVLGAGVIGASWTALFLAAGRNVSVYDPAKDTERTVRGYVKDAWSTLERLGLAGVKAPGELTFETVAVKAVENADFVQESVPERLCLKLELYSAIEPVLRSGAIVATSASGLRLSEMQTGWRDPGRFVLGHPFNPPHLIPLVEVMGNERTDPGIVESAEQFYRSLGKVTVRVNR